MIAKPGGPQRQSTPADSVTPEPEVARSAAAHSLDVDRTADNGDRTATTSRLLTGGDYLLRRHVSDLITDFLVPAIAATT